MKTTFLSIALLIGSLSILGCPTKTEPVEVSDEKSYQATQEDLQSLRSDIMALIENKSCQQTSDCELIALGARACGGPDSYEVFAPAHTDTAKLKSLTGELESLQKAYNIENQVMSICVVEPKPNYQCKQNLCQTVTHGNLIQ